MADATCTKAAPDGKGVGLAPSVTLLQREMCRETWLPVPGWEGLYEVSHLMRVRSLPRRVRTRSGWRTMGGKILRTTPNFHGYPYMTLHNGKVRVARTVHRLVGEAFLGPLPTGCETRHGRAGKLECAVSNLSYGSHIENETDKVRDGTLRRGARAGGAKLTEADVISILERYRHGELQRELAQEFGVTQTAVSLIVRGVNWAHVTAA